MHDISPQSSFNPHLSPAEDRALLSMRQSVPMLAIVAITVIALGVTSYAMIYLQKNQIRVLDESIAIKRDEIQTTYGAVSDKATLVKKQIAALAQNTTSFNFKTNLLEELASRAIKNVRLTSVALDKGVFSIEGQASSYADISKQIASWQQSKIFSSVALTTATSGKGFKQFTAEFKISGLK